MVGRRGVLAAWGGMWLGVVGPERYKEHQEVPCQSFQVNRVEGQGLVKKDGKGRGRRWKGRGGMERERRKGVQWVTLRECVLFGLGVQPHVEVRYSTQDLKKCYQSCRRHQPLLTWSAGQTTEILKSLGGIKHEAMDTRQPKPFHILP